MKNNTRDVRKLLPLLTREGMERFSDALALFYEMKDELEGINQTVQAQQPTIQARPVSWSEGKIKSFRSLVARKIWEPDLRSELVDRIVDLVVSGYVRVEEVEKIVEKAQRRKLQFEETNGVKGCESVWRTIGSWTKERWIQSGRQWTATSKQLEPQPHRQRSPLEIAEEQLERSQNEQF